MCVMMSGVGVKEGKRKREREKGRVRWVWRKRGRRTGKERVDEKLTHTEREKRERG